MRAASRAASSPADIAGKEASQRPGADRHWGRREVWAVLALCVCALVAYSNSFHAGFTFDSGYVLSLEQTHAFNRENLGLILNHTNWWPIWDDTGLYRPFTTFSILLNYAVLGSRDHPEGYHWVNFILHAGSIVLAFALALRLVRRFWPSVFIAGLWGLHPVLTESVTNIAGRSDLLGGISVLGGFLLYLKGAESRGWKRLAWFSGLLGTTMIGVSSKESAITVIGVIALYELTWWNERGRVRDLIDGMLAVLPPTMAYLYKRSAVLAASAPATFPFVSNPLTGAGFWVSRLTAVKVMARYLELLLWPARLSADYSYAQIPLVTGSPGDWMAWLAICGIGAVLVLSYKRQPAIFFFGLFAFGTFLPGSNLLFRMGTIMGERLVYLPAYGLIACFVLSMYWLAERVRMPALAPTLLLIAALGFSVRTWVRNPDWRDERALAESLVRTAPESFKAHVMLAHALYDSDSRHSDLDRALEEGERGIAVIDGLPDGLNTWQPYRQLADYYVAKGDRGPRASSGSRVAYERAARLLSRSAAILNAEPKPPARGNKVPVPVVEAESYRALSAVCMRIPDPQRAYAAAIRARDLNPSSVEAWREIASALAAAGRNDEALTALLEGQMLTGEVSLFADAIILYRTKADSGCAIIQRASGLEPNPECPVVKRQLCAAVADGMRIQLAWLRKEQARLMMNQAVEKIGCDIRPLKAALGEAQ